LLRIPYLLQLNKRDLPTALPVETLKNLLDRKGESAIEAVASKGVGVYETVREIGRLVLAQLKQE
jgi:mutual gliding-motility protein MglA